MKYYSLLLFLTLLQNNFISQVSNNFLPYFKDKKWGYCNEDLKSIIEPQFDNAYPFYNNIGLVERIRIDTFWTNKLYNEYFTYSTPLKGLINSKGEFIIKPLAGLIELYPNNIIIKYCNFSWYGHDEIDKNGNNTGKFIYTKDFVIDSSKVINYAGEAIIPAKEGYYTYMAENIIKHEKSKIQDETEYNVQYYYNGIPFWTSSFNFKISQISCNKRCCYYQNDTSTTIINFKGEKIALFNTAYTVLDDKRQLINSNNTYYLINQKGDTLEHALWQTSFNNFNAILEKVIAEEWRETILPNYRFGEFSVLNHKLHSKWILCKSNLKPEEKYLVDRNNPNNKIGPFESITSFYKGYALIKAGNFIKQVNEEGALTDLKIASKNICLTEETNELTTEVSPYYIKIKDNNLDKYYYMRVDGKIYVIN